MPWIRLERVLCGFGAALMAAGGVSLPQNVWAFSASVDRFEQVGNTTPGADEFNDGLVSPWSALFGTADEASGFLTLSSPGQVDPQPQGFSIERSDVISSYDQTRQFGFRNDSGDFTGTATFAAALPAIRESIGIAAHYAYLGSGGLLHDVVIAALTNLDPVTAALLGVAPGLVVSQQRMVSRFPSEEFIAAEDGALAPVVLPLSPGPVLVRISFNDSRNEFTTGVSLNGGLDFFSPLPPVTSNLAGFEGVWELHASRIVPEPGTSVLLALGLAVLARRGRIPPTERHDS